MKKALVCAAVLALTLHIALAATIEGRLYAQEGAAPSRADAAADSPLPTPADAQQSPLETPDLRAAEALTETEALDETATLIPTLTATETLVISPTATLSASLTETPTATVTADVLLTDTASTATPEAATPTPTVSSTATPILLVVVPSPEAPTPEATATQRPVEQPTAAPTPDYALTFARILDSTIQAAGWIWFFLGSLLFFAVAGLVAGLSFRQSERRRYQLIEDDYDDDEYDILDDPLDEESQRDNNWPASLP